MGTQKKENIEKYYTWKGNVDFAEYRNYREAQAAAQKMGIKKADPPGFVYREEAEAFSKDKWDEYIKEHYTPFDAAEYDAVVYTDGSFSSKDTSLTSYGLIIFFKGEKEPYIESCTIQDIEGGEKYKIVRYDGTGEVKEEEVCPFNSRYGKSGLVSGSHETVGELFGAMRALEICCKDRKLKKIVLIYDRKGIRQGYYKRNDLNSAEGDVAYLYRVFLQNLDEERFLRDDGIAFHKVDSHKVKGNQGQDEKEQYRVDNKETYPHGIYNDLVDILAKAETGIAISREDNFNVFRAIPDEFKGFPKTSDTGKRREHAGHARELVKNVLEKYDGKFRPVFSTSEVDRRRKVN